ncbi:MAG: helix-turn-helix transcriptional regulator [Clostridia bacterium]|nr:helix-turn-helix transcriptional regulator [Clostridia bacterium]
MFGEKLKEILIEKELTQKAAAEKLGVSQKAISKWINKQAEPTESNIRNTAKIFDVSADFLLGLEDEYGIKIKYN